MRRSIRAAIVGAATLTVLANGCNAVFGIREGHPWPGGCTDSLTIDDMEDGDGAICDSSYSASRRGEWFTLGDGTSSDLQPAPGKPFTPTLIPGGRGASRYAARMTGSGFKGSGATMGFNLNVQDLGALPYNASTTGGLRFWMKSNVPVTVSLPLEGTSRGTSGSGSCMDGPNTFNCDNHFQFVISSPNPDEWVQYDVPYAALTQVVTFGDNGNTSFSSVPWNPSALLGVQFSVAPVFGSGALTFDVWVDDVAFSGCQGTSCVPTCTDPALPVACPALTAARAGCWPSGTECSAVAVLENDFTGVWGSGPNDVWAVGTSELTDSATIAHWNGAAWSLVPAGLAGPGLGSVSGSGPRDVWSVGGHGTALHWNGSTWAAVATGTVHALGSEWVIGPDDAWAVGHDGTLLHWDGSTWSNVESPSRLFLLSVAGTGPRDAWAVGVSLVDFSGVILRWNGETWSDASMGMVINGMLGVWSSGPADGWAVGTGILHGDGTTWTSVTYPTAATNALLYGVWGSGPSDVWAVGQGGTILHWDGAAWSSVASGTTRDLGAVWGSGPSDVWAVGQAGTLIHWTGAAWSVVPASAIL